MICLPPEPEVQRTPIPDRSPPSPPHTTSAAADTPGAFLFSTSFTGVHPCQLERDTWCDGCHLLTCSYFRLAQDQRLAQCHSMLTQIMTHLGLPHVPGQREEPTTEAASLDVLAAAADSFRPTTTTAVRWLGFFFIFV